MDVFKKISAETTLLTPNRRLAAVILDKYTEWQKKQGLLCWITLDILPLYPSWLDRTLKTILMTDLASQPILLTPQQEQILWEKILRHFPDNEALLQTSETAKLAKSAWELLKRWNIQLDESALRTTEDSRAFIKWAEKFQQLCEQNHWIDQNRFADVIQEKINARPELIPKHLVFIGFTDIAPQYQRLLTQFEKKGCIVDHVTMPIRNKTTSCIGLADNETEIQTMALWAKSHLYNISNLPGSQVDEMSSPLDKTQEFSSHVIGCIVPNLETVRDQVIRIFSNTFAASEFNISAGKNLPQYPVICDALQILQLPTKNLTLATLSRILKSPFLGESEQEYNKRALFDMRLYNLNISHISLSSLLAPNNKLNFPGQCPALASRFRAAFKDIGVYSKNKLSIHSWVTHFSDILNAFGWPGERSLNSHEYQVIQNSWLPLLNQLMSLTHLLEPLSYKEALSYLTTLATNTVFQPESPKAPIQILGVLEAADIPFEYSWVMGLDDTIWPPRPKPNPFIPLRLQKSLNMPNASAERELYYCLSLTQHLQQSSEHIIFSYPTQKDDLELRPSPLLKEIPSITLDEMAVIKPMTASEKIFATRNMEILYDEVAPPISSDEVLGGVKIFKTQAECPFKAFSELRLHAKKIDDPSTGLRKLDRGNIMHKALEFLWTEIKSLVELKQLSECALLNLIHRCAERAIHEIVDISSIASKRYLTLECQRVEKLILQWIEIEKMRSPFKVIALEKEITAKIGKITAQFRVDRIDELDGFESHNKLIIDYKTGKNIEKSAWFGNRLNEPQLPIYCIINSEEIMGIAFAKINPHNMGLIGASRVSSKIESIGTLAQIPQADASLWNEQVEIWKKTLEQLGDDFYQGKADVNPKDPNMDCRLCGLHSLCRIHELNLLDSIDETQ